MNILYIILAFNYKYTSDYTLKINIKKKKKKRKIDDQSALASCSSSTYIIVTNIFVNIL